MFEYKINIEKKVIKLLGPQLYGDTASVLAELIANSYDANAKNVWITINTQGTNESIIVEDDGIGMTPKEVNDRFLNIGYDKRAEEFSNSNKRLVMGRKGIGKLAVFSLAHHIELYSIKEGQKAGCILDYESITEKDEEPIPIEEGNIIFEKDRLSSTNSGTRLVLKKIHKSTRNIYRYLVNKITRLFDIENEDFNIYIRKNSDSFKKIIHSSLEYFDKMDIFISIGDKFKCEAEKVLNNNINPAYKKVALYNDIVKETESRKNKLIEIPKKNKCKEEGWFF